MKNVKNIVILGSLVMALCSNIALAEMNSLKFICHWEENTMPIENNGGMFEVNYDSSTPNVGSVRMRMSHGPVKTYSGCELEWSENSSDVLPMRFVCSDWLSQTLVQWNVDNDKNVAHVKYQLTEYGYRIFGLEKPKEPSRSYKSGSRYASECTYHDKL